MKALSIKYENTSFICKFEFTLAKIDALGDQIFFTFFFFSFFFYLTSEM